MTPDVVELARELVRAPSPNPPGDERRVADVLREALDGAGLPRPRTVACDERRPNLLTTLDFGSGGRHLVLAGHMDTKPVGDATWTVDPFGADLDGDRLYGLGSGDMKGGVAAMVVAAARVADHAPPRGRLSLLFTADEENGAAFGSRHVASAGLDGADAVVIGEPAGIAEDFDRLHLVSRGIARARVVARSTQGHSSLAGELDGVNAGVAAARATVAVADDLALDVPADDHDLAGWEATVNAGLAFRGGVGYGVLPGRIAVETEVRLLPGMAREAVDAALSHVVARVAAGAGGGIKLGLEWDAPPNDWLEPTLVEPGHPLAVAARRACERVLGAAPPDSVFPGTTDATWFATLAGVPTLPALGPGLLRRAHAADEWVSAGATRQAVDLYVELIREVCAA